MWGQQVRIQVCSDIDIHGLRRSVNETNKAMKSRWLTWCQSGL
ncbi:unnamed protein product [Brassica oleracea var. botrytis]